MAPIVKNTHYKIISHALKCQQFSYDRRRESITEINCTCCNLNLPESIIHMIIECPSVIEFWEKIETMLDRTAMLELDRLDIRLGMIHKLFGIYETRHKNERNLINWLIFYAQTAIFLSKYYKKPRELRKIFIGLIINQLIKIYCALNCNEFEDKFCINNALSELDNNRSNIKIANFFQ